MKFNFQNNLNPRYKFNYNRRRSISGKCQLWKKWHDHIVGRPACYHTVSVPSARAVSLCRESARMRAIIDHRTYKASEIVSKVSNVCVDTSVGEETSYMTVIVMGTRAWVWWLVVGAACSRELDPGSCVARFDVQRDKIIRTEESREMGARYLSELDVGARSECLRLCCETDSCDVFVFEEKVGWRLP